MNRRNKQEPSALSNLRFNSREKYIEEVVKVHRANSGKHLKFIKLFGQNN